MSIVMAELVLNWIMSIRLTEQKIMPHLAQLLSHTYLLQGNDLSKEYVWVFGQKNITCISLNDEIKN